MRFQKKATGVGGNCPFLCHYFENLGFKICPLSQGASVNCTPELKIN